MTERGYQYGFSKGNAAMHAVEGRQRKALTMLAVLEEALGPERLARARVLNVGCSTGIIDEVLSTRVAHSTGIDIDQDAIELARERCSAANTSFEVGDAMSLDFPDGSMDIIICSQVYEHVPDPVQMMREIRRVLAADGVCYFAATNRWCVIEQHYKLPFLSIVPVSWAHRYLRILGRGRFYHERHLTLFGLRRLTGEFLVNDFTSKVLADPDRYGTRYMVNSRLKGIVAGLWVHLAYWCFPGYVWVLSKRG
ncbi:class I SAM-dependent methyltransferase [Dyella soli]|uniref:Class I SAM-dependent methyltransferase n=1 Tax=Dyella soli TaxID=522319 RepID=A0A4R0YVL8_9GAMM|nr:class I SAM-dependent methyltransferase [Dyella soli]TCI10948.1 class I SAM-dependent methyltransferase [Dyella soli]